LDFTSVEMPRESGALRRESDRRQHNDERATRARTPAKKDIARLRGAQLQSAPLWDFERMDQAAPTRKI
jgi:hypothetical protein